MIEAFFLSLILAAIHYFVLNHIVWALLILLINVLIWMVFFQTFKMITKQYTTLYHMYFLMHSVITNLAIKKHVHESIWEVISQLTVKHPHLENLTGHDGIASLVNFKTIYPYKLFSLFVASLQFYDQQGGEVMELFDNFLRQARISETRIQEEEQFYKRGLIEFTTLWIFNILVLLLSKWALRYVYDSVLNNDAVVLLLSLVFVWLPMSYVYYQKRYQHYSFSKEQQ
jgi:hypothetical protein